MDEPDAELIEHVARALVSSRGDDPDEGVGKTPQGQIILRWECFIQSASDHITAVAAIRALLAQREATPAAAGTGPVAGYARVASPPAL